MVERWRARLRSALRASGMTPAEIAEETALPVARIRHVLSGALKRPPLETIAAIAHAAGTTVGVLLGEAVVPLAPEDVRRIRVFTMFLGRVLHRVSRTPTRRAEPTHDFEVVGSYADFLRGEERGAAVRVEEVTMMPVLYPDDIVRVEKREPEEGDVICAQVDGRHVFGYLAGDALEQLHGLPIPRREIQHVLGVVTAVIDRDINVPRRRS